MNKSQCLLETMNDFTKSDDEIVLRANHRYGTRCIQCGRLFSHIDKLPATRTCPNKECGLRYEISRSNRGLLFRRINTT
jgi:uncharacterized OB-fold protein